MCIILYLANIIVQPLLDHQFDKDAFLQTTSALFTIASPSIYNRGKDHAVSWLALHSTSIKGVNEPHQPLFRHKEKTKITTIIVMMNQDSFFFFSGLFFLLPNNPIALKPHTQDFETQIRDRLAWEKLINFLRGNFNPFLVLF